MFHVRVELRQSAWHGIGLFAGEDISKGEKIYTENLSLDLLLSESEFSMLSDDEKKTIKHYGYFDKNKRKWHLAFDDIRFCNHSVDPNLILKDGSLVAKKDIKKDEELTQDYRDFEELRAELEIVS